ncbi:MoaD/ThiS family protein [Candidatus Rariloculus sp.]|uniref:MoaD/ThiS family protein n=1 Tax=Candidatus Rariloculus sp. TaxID=3101265 RepID=UPI003D0BE91E
MLDVTARYFAVFREQAGCGSEQVATAAATTGEFFSEVAARHGFLDAQVRCKVAVNGELAGWDAVLSDADEILFFPPVAGG